MHQDLFEQIARAGSNPCEKIPTLVTSSASAAADLVAAEIARVIRTKAERGAPCVLGLATGSTPIAVYRELIRLHREEGLSFRHVTTFNLDEYFPCDAGEACSYRRFMRENLFDHIDIDPARTHFLNGSMSRDAIPSHCAAYEMAIETAGGIDLQLLGIGRTGHIAFNEPGASGSSRTRLVTLHATTLADNRQLVPGARIPFQALTMGVGTVLEARRILMLAFGEHKSAIVREAIEGPVTDAVTASFLQNHPAAIAILDEAAAGDLTRVHAPWLLGPLELRGLTWTGRYIRQAVIWLSQKTGKAILRLEDADYTRNGLEELLATEGDAYTLNLRVFRALQSTVSGWPAGHPAERHSLPRQKRILVFSPHPDDDVISMGGTLARLADQQHIVHVAYQVSGANAVSRDFLARQLDFLHEAGPAIGTLRLPETVEAMAPDLQRHLAACIRRAEARSAAAVVGIPAERCHFLDQPFYERPGRAWDADDVVIIRELLAGLQPEQIYAAGDLADPHGTHRLCLECIEAAIQAEKEAGADWTRSCEAWLYRGAWGVWRIHEVDRAIPLSPAEVLRKRRAILRHQSQKDETPFPGDDSREFWQRAEDRTREAAAAYRQLGWADYAALEPLARWSILP